MNKEEINEYLITLLNLEYSEYNSYEYNEQIDNTLTFITKILIDKGADVNYKTKDEETPLTFACINYNRRKLTELLLKNGADVNTTDWQGNTGLHMASLKDDLEMVKILVKYGADVNKVDNFLDTPLDIAYFYKHTGIYKFLKEYGAKTYDELEKIK